MVCRRSRPTSITDVVLEDLVVAREHRGVLGGDVRRCSRRRGARARPGCGPSGRGSRAPCARRGAWHSSSSRSCSLAASSSTASPVCLHRSDEHVVVHRADHDLVDLGRRVLPVQRAHGISLRAGYRSSRGATTSKPRPSGGRDLAAVEGQVADRAGQPVGGGEVDGVDGAQPGTWRRARRPGPGTGRRRARRGTRPSRRAARATARRAGRASTATRCRPGSVSVRASADAHHVVVVGHRLGRPGRARWSRTYRRSRAEVSTASRSSPVPAARPSTSSRRTSTARSMGAGSSAAAPSVAAAARRGRWRRGRRGSAPPTGSSGPSWATGRAVDGDDDPLARRRPAHDRGHVVAQLPDPDRSTQPP